jgi:membrane-bound acyltransferase YfiQ involved in biofilm formation
VPISNTHPESFEGSDLCCVLLTSLWCEYMMFAEQQQILQHQWVSHISVLLQHVFNVYGTSSEVSATKLATQQMTVHNVFVLHGHHSPSWSYPLVALCFTSLI